MVHTTGIQQDLGLSMGIGGSCATGGKEIGPIDLVALGLASCLLTMLGKAAESRQLDLTGTWADACFSLQNYRLVSFSIAIYSPAQLEPGGGRRDRGRHP